VEKQSMSCGRAIYNHSPEKKGKRKRGKRKGHRDTLPRLWVVCAHLAGPRGRKGGRKKSGLLWPKPAALIFVGRGGKERKGEPGWGRANTYFEKKKGREKKKGVHVAHAQLLPRLSLKKGGGGGGGKGQDTKRRVARRPADPCRKKEKRGGRGGRGGPQIVAHHRFPASLHGCGRKKKKKKKRKKGGMKEQDGVPVFQARFSRPGKKREKKEGGGRHHTEGFLAAERCCVVATERKKKKKKEKGKGEDRHTACHPLCGRARFFFAGGEKKKKKGKGEGRGGGARHFHGHGRQKKGKKKKGGGKAGGGAPGRGGRRGTPAC